MKVEIVGNYRSWMIFMLMLLASKINSEAQTLNIQQKDGGYAVSIISDDGESITMPTEGLWSIATAWENDWPADWKHARAVQLTTSGDWKILSGTMDLPEGSWHFQDAYLQEKGRIKCIRRFEWKGDKELEKITLAV